MTGNGIERLTHDQYVAALDAAARDFAAVVADGDLAAEVPGCPGWTLADLTRHLGGVHRWATGIVLTGEMGERPDGPAADEELHPWFVEGADALLTAIRGTDPRSPAWTFGPEPHTAGFWARRQAHETTVHLWDAMGSQGRSLAIDPALAADGVDEVATVFLARQVRLGRIDALPGGLRLELEGGGAGSGGDGPRVRAVSLAGDGTDPEAPTQATLRGPAQSMLLALWRRTGTGGLTITGDSDLVATILATAITS